MHLRPGSPIPSDYAAARAWMRRGSLAEAMLPGGPGLAVRAGDSELSHEELAAHAAQLAGGLLAEGVRPRDRVALFAARSLQWILAYLALIRLGAVAIPVNPAYTERELGLILEDAGPRAIICDSARRHLVAAATEGRGRPPAVLDLAQLQPEAAAPWPKAGPDAAALIVYTSGTTGRPKGAVLDAGNVLAQARGVVEAWRWEARDRLVHALPLFHIHGLLMGLTGTLLAQASLELVEWSPASVVSALEGGASMFFGVPAMYERLVSHLDREPADLSRVRLFVSGSAPLAPALFQRCVERLGQPPLERYGLTEGGIIVSNPYAGPRRAGRVGYPLPGVELELADGGEILVRGGQVFSGYLHEAGGTGLRLADGWLHTQDVGELDADGSLAIRGRLRDLIISGGYNVHPREVELILEQHPMVREVAVAGVPSERWGEEVRAYVVSRGPVTQAELMEHCRGQLAPYKCPRQVHFIEELPRNSMGKVMRSALADLAST